MRAMWTGVTAVVLWCGLVGLGNAAEGNAAKREAAQKGGAASAAIPRADLRAEIHRTMAALIEAQAAEKPDPEKIDALTKELQRLRAECWAQGGSAVGMGFGPGRGMGYGRGAGWGMGGGRGWGGGRGFGPGGGRGLAPGGPAFVDENKNGVCDWFELRRGTGPR
jgi:hypothetical protein